MTRNGVMAGYLHGSELITVRDQRQSVSTSGLFEECA